MKRKKRSVILPVCLASILSVLVLFPVYVLVLCALKEPTSIFELSLLPKSSQIRLENFSEVFERIEFGRYMLNSFIVAFSVTIVALLFHSMAGFAFSHMRFRGKNAIFVGIMITAAIPFSVIMIPLFIIVRSMGIANSLLALILPMIPHAYGIFLYRQFFAGIPHEFYEAAMIDGASYSRTLFQVFFTMAIPVTISMAVAFFLTNWNNYLWPLVVIHDRNLWVVQLAITSFKESYSSAWNLIFAASLMASIPIILLFVFLQRYFISSVKLAGIKG